VKFLTFSLNREVQIGVCLEEGNVFLLTQAWKKHIGSDAPVHVGELVKLGDEGVAIAAKLIADKASDVAFSVNLAQVQVLAPIPNPSKNVFCIGRNYREHIIEGNRARGRSLDDFPKNIEVFTKPPTAIIGHNGAIHSHKNLTSQLDYEVELAIVVSKRGRDIPKEKAFDYVFGYTIINDVTARDLQKSHGQWFKGKGLDTTCPIGPYVTHKSAIADPHALNIQLSVNGQLRQRSSTSDLLFRIDEIMSQLSAGMTLEAGDIIATGTPFGVGLGLTPPVFLKEGDVITAKIDGLGELTNRIED
jgi:2-keto-4-pentenoate hydratase/2-oxohepta-3-ene-1,7-dioic acid hydratase in catechol pathway